MGELGKMFDVIAAISTNLFRTYLTKRFMGVFFEQSTVSKKKENICYAIFFLLTVSVYLLFHYPPANIVTNVTLMFVIACLYEGELKKKILVTLLIYGINMICDVLAMFSFSNYFYTAGEDYNLIVAYVTVLLIALCEYVIERSWAKREIVNFAPPYWKFILLVPVISIIMLHLLIVSNLNNRVALVVVSACTLVINLLIFYLYNAIIDAYRKLEENAAYEIQNASYRNQLDVLMQTEETIHSLRHDLKHHLGELYILSKKNANADIMDYISEMQKFISNDKEYVRSGNKEIDSILNYMLSKANKVLDKVEYKISIPQEIGIKSFDATVLFGNLIENAIEAAEVCQGEKWLSVELQYEKGILYVNVKNNYSFLDKKGATYMTTKREKGHGIGLQSIKRIVSVYRGSMEITDADNVFDVKILLYI